MAITMGVSLCLLREEAKRRKIGVAGSRKLCVLPKPAVCRAVYDKK